MKARMLGIALVAAVLVAGSAYAGKTKEALDKSALPAGFVVGSGDPARALNVVVADGRVVSSAAASPDEANVTARSSMADGQTTLTIAHRLAANLKFDLYLSADGERFEYTSSCVVTPGVASFELWQQPVKAFALGNPRVLPGRDLRCD